MIKRKQHQNVTLTLPRDDTNMMMIMICLLLFIFFLFIAIKSFEAIREKEVSVQCGSPKFPYRYLISGKCVEANCPYGAVASHLNGGIC